MGASKRANRSTWFGVVLYAAGNFRERTGYSDDHQRKCRVAAPQSVAGGVVSQKTNPALSVETDSSGLPGEKQPR